MLYKILNKELKAEDAGIIIGELTTSCETDGWEKVWRLVETSSASIRSLTVITAVVLWWWVVVTDLSGQLHRAVFKAEEVQKFAALAEETWTSFSTVVFLNSGLLPYRSCCWLVCSDSVIQVALLCSCCVAGVWRNFRHRCQEDGLWIHRWYPAHPGVGGHAG